MAVSYYHSSSPDRKLLRTSYMGSEISMKGKNVGDEIIPDDILVDILNRLPVKSLDRLRSVSKRWRSIISDPQFTKSLPKPRRRRLLYFSASHLKSLYLDETIASPPPIKTLTCPHKLSNSVSVSESAKILGSCNGMVCLAFSSNILFVWNPTTGFLRRLPEPGFPLRHEKIMYYGFGYCSATDDYKVVVDGRLFDYSRNCYYGEIETRLFSCRAGVWKTIESPTYVSESATYLRDKLHWLQVAHFPIVAFDLVEEKERFQMIPKPWEFNVDYIRDCEMYKCDSWGGELYLYRRFFSYGVESIELWVMRECGEGDSWNKLCEFKLPYAYTYPGRDRRRGPFLALGESSTIVATLVHRKMTYEKPIRIRHGEKQLVVNEVGDSYASDMIMYEESLLQLPECHDHRVPANG